MTEHGPEIPPEQTNDADQKEAPEVAAPSQPNILQEAWNAIPQQRKVIGGLIALGAAAFTLNVFASGEKENPRPQHRQPQPTLTPQSSRPTQTPFPSSSPAPSQRAEHIFGNGTS